MPSRIMVWIMNDKRNTGFWGEIWECENELFPEVETKKQKSKKQDRKKRLHKQKFYLIPVVVFMVIFTMFGKSGVYEYNETVYYVVVQGDTLWDISRRYLGKGYKYLQIVNENKIENPDLIYPGDEYRIIITHRVRIKD